MDDKGQLSRFARVRQHIAACFRVVAGEPDEQASPNTISAAEARRLGRLICNVLSGVGQLTFDPKRSHAADLYGSLLPALGPRARQRVEALALDDLTRIAQTRVGRAVLHALANAKHRTTIVMDGHDAPSVQATNVSPSGPGPADARIFFTPGISYARADWTQDSEGLTGWELANPSHSVLLHELLHARGTVYGLRDVTLVDVEDGVLADAGKVAREEHRVIGLGKYSGETLTQTQYIRERNAIGRDGFGATPSDTALTPRTRYSAEERRSVGKTHDPVYADLFVAMTLDAEPSMPAHVCAWAQRNRGMLEDQAFVAAVQRAVDESYADEVRRALARPREAALHAYLEWLAT